MIRFIEVWAGNKPKKPKDFIFRDATIDFIPGQHTGIWHQRVDEWKCFYPLACGIKNPYYGKIKRMARVSWPIGWTGVFTPALTIRANLTFIARINGCSKQKMIDFVVEFADPGNWLDKPFARCPELVKRRTAFAVPFAIPFDFFLGSNGLTVGDKKFSQKCTNLVTETMQRATFIIWSTRQLHLKRAKDRSLMFRNGQFIELPGINGLHSLGKLHRYVLRHSKEIH